jgi:hypothetical protein
MPYHKGPGVQKSGPKGPWKAKGKVLETIFQLNQNKPWLSGEQISAMVEKKTGTRLTRQRVNQIRHEVGGKSYSRRSIMEAPSPATPASRS